MDLATSAHSRMMCACTHMGVSVCVKMVRWVRQTQKGLVKSPSFYIQFVSVFHSLPVCVEGSRSDQHTGQVTAATYTNTTYRHVPCRYAVWVASIYRITIATAVSQYSCILVLEHL